MSASNGFGPDGGGVEDEREVFEDYTAVLGKRKENVYVELGGSQQQDPTESVEPTHDDTNNAPVVLGKRSRRDRSAHRRSNHSNSFSLLDVGLRPLPAARAKRQGHIDVDVQPGLKGVVGTGMVGIHQDRDQHHDSLCALFAACLSEQTTYDHWKAYKASLKPRYVKYQTADVILRDLGWRFLFFACRVQRELKAGLGPD